MAKTKNNLSYIINIIGITIVLLAILFTIKASVLTYSVFLGLWFIGLLVAYILINLRKRSLEGQEDITSERIELLDEETARKIMNAKCEEKNIIPVNESTFVTWNIQPENPEKSPTEFFVRVFQHQYSDYHFLQYINRKDGIVLMARSEDPLSRKQIQEYLEGSAESTREHISTTKLYNDPELGLVKVESSYKRPRQTPKFQTKKDENEEIEE